MSVIYAVDLGTTYSKCAFVHPQSRELTVLRLRTGGEVSRDGDFERDAPLRSAVALCMEGGSKVAYVGDRARARIGEPDVRVIEESKAWIGERNNGGLDSPPWEVAAHGYSYKPQDIGAIVLRRIKQIVDATYPHYPMESVLITHPQRFEDPRREATRQAGRIAGLIVTGTITEPDAAAYYFRHRWGPSDGVHLVFDIGGGTLDVNVVQLQGGNASVNVLGSNGTHVGGRVYDHRIFARMVERYSAHNAGFEENYLGGERNRWMQLAEEMKLSLCAGQERARKKLTCRSDYYEGEELDFVLDAQQYDALTADLTDKSRECCEAALDTARVHWKDIDQVVMVGGSSHNPWLKRMLAAVSGKQPHTSLGASTAIVQGAALLAEKLPKRPSLYPGTASGQAAPLTPDLPAIRSVLPQAVGVRAFDRESERDVMMPLVAKNQALPYTHFQRFLTTEANQQAIPVEIYEGDAPEPELCTLIGTCLLTGLPPNRAAGYAVTVRIDIDVAGGKKITARDEDTGVESVARIKYDEERVVSDQDLPERRRFVQSLIVRG